MMLLLMIMLIWDVVVVVDNVIEMRWSWCWEWYWDEKMLMLRMTLRWDNVKVDNDIEIKCWKCIFDDACCLCTWGCSDHVGYP